MNASAAFNHFAEQLERQANDSMNQTTHSALKKAAKAARDTAEAAYEEYEGD